MTKSCEKVYLVRWCIKLDGGSTPPARCDLLLEIVCLCKYPLMFLLFCRYETSKPPGQVQQGSKATASFPPLTEIRLCQRDVGPQWVINRQTNSVCFPLLLGRPEACVPFEVVPTWTQAKQALVRHLVVSLDHPLRPTDLPPNLTRLRLAMISTSVWEWEECYQPVCRS